MWLQVFVIFACVLSSFGNIFYGTVIFEMYSATVIHRRQMTCICVIVLMFLICSCSQTRSQQVIRYNKYGNQEFNYVLTYLKSVSCRYRSKSNIKTFKWYKHCLSLTCSKEFKPKIVCTSIHPDCLESPPGYSYASILPIITLVTILFYNLLKWPKQEGTLTSPRAIVTRHAKLNTAVCQNFGFHFLEQYSMRL